MQVSEKQQQLLRLLPGVDHVMATALKNSAMRHIPKSILTRSIRECVADLRRKILDHPTLVDQDSLSLPMVLDQVNQRIAALEAYNLKHVINATGVVVHTNLGRSNLAPTAIEQVMQLAGGYSNLEYDLTRGKRGSRYSAVEELLCEISGAQAALAVNNNAGAVLLCLDTLANGKSVIISRGELVEIGGSFRIPDVMAKSGALLEEVGTTNRTHLRDYEAAIGSDTGLLLKVHASNYSIVGFTASVALSELVALGAQFNLPVMEDLGSGNFIDLSRYGLATEPTVQASVAAGTDVVTFSGDKLLGGPQAGLIVGKRAMLDRIKSNPLTRALRIDKMTLAALEATLRLYRDESRAVAQIPTLRMLTTQQAQIEQDARDLADGLISLEDPRLRIEMLNLSSRAGGGALPMLSLPSCCVGVHIDGQSTNQIETALRNHQPPIIGRIENDLYIMDLRTIQKDETDIIINAFERLLRGDT